MHTCMNEHSSPFGKGLRPDTDTQQFNHNQHLEGESGSGGGEEGKGTGGEEGKTIKTAVEAVAKRKVTWVRWVQAKSPESFDHLDEEVRM